MTGMIIAKEMVQILTAMKTRTIFMISVLAAAACLGIAVANYASREFP